jgi:hypothetical protein
MSDHSAPADDLNLPYVFGLLGGGLSLGFGVIMLWYSFGHPAGPMADHLGPVGFSGLEQIQRLGAADYSIGFIVLGAVIMVLLNAGAWRRTGGY